MAGSFGLYEGKDTGGDDLPLAPRDSAGVYTLTWETLYTVFVLNMSKVPTGRCRTILVVSTWKADALFSSHCLQASLSAMSIGFLTPARGTDPHQSVTVQLQETGPDLVAPRVEKVEFVLRLRDNPTPPPTPPSNISGTYELTITASPVCTNLPNDLQRRTYLARVEQAPSSNVFGNLVVRLEGPFAGPQDYCAPGNWFSGSLDNDAVRFALETNAVAPCEDWGGLPSIIERVGPQLYWAVQGRAHGLVDEALISGRVEGSLLLSRGRNDLFTGPHVTTCVASDHTFYMRRR